MYNRRIYVGLAPEQLTIAKIFMYFKGRTISYEPPYIYFEISKPAWKDENFLADLELFGDIEVYR